MGLGCKLLIADTKIEYLTDNKTSIRIGKKQRLKENRQVGVE